VAIAALALLAPTAKAMTHTVNQVNRAFDPSDLIVSVGDTVQWIWSSLPHTVTNGIDLNDSDPSPAAGAERAQPLQSTHGNRIHRAGGQ
jgi:plastocyanin